MPLLKKRLVGQVVELPISRIRPNPHQPRQVFSEEGLDSLARSIREVGVLQPLTVVLEGDTPVLVAGERRLRAAARAGRVTVPCLVVEAEESRSAVLALVENLQRQDLHCFEEAEGIRRLMECGKLTQTEAAKQLGLSQPAVANKLRLLQLSPDQRTRLTAAGCTERHARALLRLDDPTREAVLRRMIAENWTVAQTERAVAARLHPTAKKRIKPLIRDIRLFFNTVEHAVDTMKKSGVAALAEQRETEDAYEYLIRIPKNSPAMRP